MHNMSSARLLLRGILALLAFVALIFLPAGTLNWPEGQAFVLTFLLYGASAMMWLWKNNSGLLRARLDYARVPRKGWDKAIMVWFYIFATPLYILPGLDAVRYGWSHVPVELKAAGFAGNILSLIAVFWVMRTNTYLFRTVEVRRGQKAITTGPYRYVRHPMYAAVIVMLLSMPLALGSYYSLIPAAGMVLGIVARTHLEDEALHKELEGYEEYAKKTKYRLVPGVW